MPNHKVLNYIMSLSKCHGFSLFMVKVGLAHTRLNGAVASKGLPLCMPALCSPSMFFQMEHKLDLLSA
jgi:hypothetical protein